jgi:hypothetical protein
LIQPFDDFGGSMTFKWERFPKQPCFGHEWYTESHGTKGGQGVCDKQQTNAINISPTQVLASLQK